MSKVIHLSDDAHNKAKEFCRDNALKMSDWVAALINLAIHGDTFASAAATAAQANLRTLVPKKKYVPPREEAVPEEVDTDQPAYAAPPFWAQAKH
jgi:hypothetical protein